MGADMCGGCEDGDLALVWNLLFSPNPNICVLALAEWGIFVTEIMEIRMNFYVFIYTMN
jgi:uncharacterized protein YbbC (DUF1343 family)